ncbi:MAG: carbamoyltransferase [Nitrosomonadales bacterium]|nr:carbamoyltransferase [Nitrosomonadales bacterium]
MKKRSYVGLACTGHDNALAIVNAQGELVFAEAAERYLQNKRAFLSPPDDTFRIGKLIEEYCGADDDIVIAKTWSGDVKAIFERESQAAAQVLQNAQQSPVAWQKLFGLYQATMALFLPPMENAGANLSLYCGGHPTRNAIHKRYNHHLTHAATACYTSPFEEAVCLIVDGYGEGASVTAYAYKDGRLEAVGPDSYPLDGLSSLGIFYGAIVCDLCGFSAFEGEEWKVMGLAPYGKLDQSIYEMMRRVIRVNGLRIEFADDAPNAVAELEKYRRAPGSDAITVADLAHTGQQFFADILTQLLDNLYEMGISENLVLGGGCALNSSCAGRILDRTRFKNMHIFSAPADDGNAVGAAYLAYYEDHPEKRPKVASQSPYLGSTLSTEVLGHLAKFGHIDTLVKLPYDELYQKTARLLAEGKVVAWVQGRAEFGPRALGNRSILADPRDPAMKDKINGRVKFREEFRPFAPSILEEFGDEYFIHYQDTPYMERTLVFREEVRSRVPAVVHEDNTGRLQSVKKEWNPHYYGLIEAFYKLTGVPILLNTSLNVMGKPIVHSVEDAIALFYTTGVDVLVLEDYIIEKR